MTATLISGQRKWSLTRSEEGHRNYTITHLVETSTSSDGPAIVILTPGLPAIGSFWSFDNDVDLWAFCTPQRKVTIHQAKEGDPVTIYAVESNFTTRPFNRCNTTTIEDPILEPQKISGSFVKYTKEAIRDNTGARLKNSSHEQIRGPQAEIDANRPSVHIEQNVLDLELDVFSPLVDNVNNNSMWGLSARKIKLSNVSWERRHYGSCFVYYTRAFDFDIDFNTYDRNIFDEGTKVLEGKWTDADPPVWDTSLGQISSPDINNPTHFVRYTDPNGNNIRGMLNGSAVPLTVAASPFITTYKIYPETNFFVLNIPTIL